MPVLAACHLIYVFSVVLHCISIHVVANKVLSLTHTRETAWYIISVVCVCKYVCQTITLENLDSESSYLYIRYISREYGSSSYMKVIGSRSRLQEPVTLVLGLGLDPRLKSNSLP